MDAHEIQSKVDAYSIKNCTQLYQHLIENENYSGCLRTLQRQCSSHDIVFNTTRRDNELDHLVNSHIRVNGTSYGRRMTRGSLRAEGHIYSEREVRESMLHVAPEEVAFRSHNAHRLLNPMKYHAPLFGYNWHFDQNEKLAQYGCTMVAAVDGHANMILGIKVMDYKNNITITRDLFLPLLELYGLPEQVLVDCGKEFSLLLFTQNVLEANRRYADGSSCTRPAFRRLKSTQNNRIERLWKEVNERVNYLVRQAMSVIEDRGLVDINILSHQFVIGHVIRGVTVPMLKRCMQAWNHHRIPNAGVPIERTQPSTCFPVANLPTIEQLCDLFVNDGGHLTAEHSWGLDPVPVHRRSYRDAMWRQQLRFRGGYEAISVTLAEKQFQPLERLMCSLIDINIQNSQ